MAVTSTTSFTVTRDAIISYALRKIGVLELGVTADATVVTNASEALNMMTKSWITKGIKLWTATELSLPLVSGQTSYTIGPASNLVANKPMKLVQAWLRDTTATPDIDIPLQVVSKYEYNLFSSKYSTSTPNSVYLDVGRDVSTLYVYLTPDSTAAGKYQLRLSTQRQIFDVSAASDNLDFPSEWYYTLGWNLALELATDNAVDEATYNRVAAMATKTLAEVEDFDREDTSVFFTPTQRR